MLYSQVVLETKYLDCFAHRMTTVRIATAPSQTKHYAVSLGDNVDYFDIEVRGVGTSRQDHCREPLGSMDRLAA